MTNMASLSWFVFFFASKILCEIILRKMICSDLKYLFQILIILLNYNLCYKTNEYFSD